MLALVCSTVAFSLGVLDDKMDRPPPLTLGEPVDYVAWCNAVLRDGRKGEPREVYKWLCDPRLERGGFPIISGAEKRQCDRIGFTLWEAGSYPAFEAFLKKCERPLVDLRRVVRKKTYWYQYTNEEQLLFPHKIPAATAGWSGSLAVMRNGWRRQPDQVKAILDAHVFGLQVASHAKQMQFLRGSTNNLGARHMVYDSTLAAIGTQFTSEDHFVRAYKLIKKYDPGCANYTDVIKTEWARTLNTLQYVCPKGELDNSQWMRLCDHAKRMGGKYPTSMTFKADTTLDYIEKHYATAQVILKGKPSMKKLNKFADYCRNRYPEMRQLNQFFRQCVPRYLDQYGDVLAAETKRRGVLLALAIHAHHAKHGEWPDSLKDIDKKLGLKGLKKLRRDPLAREKAEFFYRLRDDAPLLYSVGFDQFDDKGEMLGDFASLYEHGDLVVLPK